jgi:hypothetical protein
MSTAARKVASKLAKAAALDASTRLPQHKALAKTLAKDYAKAKKENAAVKKTVHIVSQTLCGKCFQLMEL